MNRRERLMAMLHGKPVDRPGINLYEIGGLRMDPQDEDPFNIYRDESWQPLLELAEEHSDLIRMRSPVRAQSHQSWEATPGQKGIWSEFFQLDTYEENGCRMTRTTLNIAGRTMTSLTRREKDVDTIWMLEPLLKSTDDVKAYLQLPDEVFAENIDIPSLLQEEQSLGEKGILMVDTEDPLCAAASLFSMEDYTILALTESRLFHQLLEQHARYIHRRTETIARDFPGRLWRIYGPEYATEPYLPPKFFQEYVVRYTGAMVRQIRKYGGFVRIHCHGRIRNVLDYIAAMEADALDPVEPPPQGDIELIDVREKYGEQMILFGNIEVCDIENMAAKPFARMVKNTLQDGTTGKGRGFVLMPTASPFCRKITPQTLENYKIMVQMVLDYSG